MYRLKQLTLLIGDLLGLYAGLYLALALRYANLSGLESRLTDLLPPFTHLFLAALVIMFIVGLYDVGRAKNDWIFYQKIIISAVVWMLCGVIYFYVRPGNFVTPKTILFLTAISGFGLTALWRYLNNRFLSPVIWRNNVIFIGLAVETIELIKLINSEPGMGYNIIGVVSSDTALAVPPNIRVVNKFSELMESAGKQIIHLIVVAPQFAADNNLLRELYRSLFRQTEIVNLDRFYETLLGRIPPFIFSESWFLTNLREQQKRIYDRFRVFVDYAIAIIIGIFFIITLPFIALAIKINSRGPIFFSQERVGRLGKTFRIHKYRTMQSLAADGSAEINGPKFAAAKDERITGVGQFLRRTRLDEIPQFINILRGEMSIVGPRPERPEFTRQLTEAMPFYALRQLVKPGLTGWAQLQKDYYGNIEENLYKLQYDLYYIKNRGPILDAAILLKTMNTLLRMAGR